MKKIFVSGLAVATLSLATLSAGAALAHQGSNSNDLAGKLSERFSLSESEVQTFLDEERQVRRAERAQEREEYLQTKVDDGTITQEQKDQLIEKKSEVRALVESLKDQDLNRSEIREQTKALKDEIKQWAESEGIDLEALRPDGHKNKRR